MLAKVGSHLLGPQEGRKGRYEVRHRHERQPEEGHGNRHAPSAHQLISNIHDVCSQCFAASPTSKKGTVNRARLLGEALSPYASIPTPMLASGMTVERRGIRIPRSTPLRISRAMA